MFGTPCFDTVPIPVALCSWYLSMSMWRLVMKKSSLAWSLWCIDTISFFCLDSEELCLSRLMLKENGTDVCLSNRHMYAGVVCTLVYVLHGSFLPLLKSLPVFLQSADGVPHLATCPPQRTVSQNVCWVFFYEKKGKQRHSQTINLVGNPLCIPKMRIV